MFRRQWLAKRLPAGADRPEPPEENRASHGFCNEESADRSTPPEPIVPESEESEHYKMWMNL